MKHVSPPGKPPPYGLGKKADKECKKIGINPATHQENKPKSWIQCLVEYHLHLLILASGNIIKVFATALVISVPSDGSPVHAQTISRGTPKKSNSNCGKERKECFFPVLLAELFLCVCVQIAQLEGDQPLESASRLVLAREGADISSHDLATALLCVLPNTIPGVRKIGGARERLERCVAKSQEVGGGGGCSTSTARSAKR